MSRKITPARKVAEAVADGLNRKDFSVYQCADILTKSVSPDEYMAFAMAIIDVAAIRFDHGLYDAHEYEQMRKAAVLRDAHETA